MCDKGYPIPKEEMAIEDQIKKSRFICYLAHAEGKEAALSYVQSIREAYPDARHHCWAYIGGAPTNSTDIGMSDDGEPHGTAGKPMLSTLGHSGIGEVVAVVVRYFGGTKLGTGGLVRAYTGAVQHALDELETYQKVKLTTLKVTYPFALESTIRRILTEKPTVNTLAVNYSQQVEMVLELPAYQEQDFQEFLTNRTNGQIGIS